MLLISHRGNTDNIDPDRENSPAYINEAIEKGFVVMVDVWLIGEQHLSLGANHPQYPTDVGYLKQNKIICHARNVHTLQFLLDKEIHCFYHDRDTVTLTNGGLIWSLPGLLRS